MTGQVALYARVAVGGEGAGKQELDRQWEACHRHAEGHGWEIVAELAEDERGVSGSSLDRPQLNWLLDMARANQFHVLVMRDLYRLGRDLENLLVLQEERRQHGVQITSIQQAGEMPVIVSLEIITTESRRANCRHRLRSVPMAQHKA